MYRAVRVFLLALLAPLALPVAANAASVTVANGAITFTAGAGEANTAVIAKQQSTPIATVYFVGDQNPNVTVTASALQGCVATPPALGLPQGFLCTVPFLTPVTSLVENLGDGNDTGVINADSSPPNGTIDGGTGDDTLVGGRQNDIFRGGTGTDSVAYVGIDAAGITRTSPVTATLPTTAAPTAGNGQAGENDSIAADIEGLTGGNGNDTLVGNDGANTIAGSAPPGTPSVNPQPPGTESRDAIHGGGADDTLVSGDSGSSITGGEGNDTIVGGRSFANVTNINAGNGDDTIVSGLGNDNMTGGAGSNTLAYVSVSQGGLNVVSRSTGVLARLPEPGATAAGGTIAGQEQDVIHDDIRTMIGSNRDDFLIGSSGVDTIVGAAPVGTGSGVVDTPAGNDAILGLAGNDTLVAGDRGWLWGDLGNDNLVGGRSTTAGQRTVIHGNDGNDTIVSGLGNDEVFGDAGSNTLAYASVQQGAIDIVNRPLGVTAILPEPGQTAPGGRSGGPEQDIIHSDVNTLVGSNGNDILIGNSLGNTLVGVAPAGTAGVKPGPSGNDAYVGFGGNDLMLGAEGQDVEFGGDGNDTLLGFDGPDILMGNNGVDNFNAGAGNDTNYARDGVAEAVLCGAGSDTVQRDAIDTTPANDCETFSAALATLSASQERALDRVRRAAGKPLPR